MTFKNLKDELNVLNEIIRLLVAYENDKKVDMQIALLEIEAESAFQRNNVQLLSAIIMTSIDEGGDLIIIRKALENFIRSEQNKLSKGEHLINLIESASGGVVMENILHLSIWSEVVGDESDCRLRGLWNNSEVLVSIRLKHNGYEIDQTVVGGKVVQPSALLQLVEKDQLF